MKIKLSPVRADTAPLQATVKNGDTIVINGELFDFSPLQAGETLPVAAMGGTSPFVSDIERDKSGELHFTLRLPHGAFAPKETRFPVAFTVPMIVIDGEVPLPPYDEVPEVPSEH